MQHQHVARMKRTTAGMQEVEQRMEQLPSEIRGGGARTFPDFAALYPGYTALNTGQYDE
jgi:hypothetical protein